jgi:cytochrome P450
VTAFSVGTSPQIWIVGISLHNTLTGPRACPGRKFAATEVVCFLSLLLRDWRAEPLLLNGEDMEGWRQRVLDAEMKLTMHICPASLRLVPRAA